MVDKMSFFVYKTPMTSTIKFPLSLYNALDLEIYVLIGILCIISFVFYKFFLKNVSKERHLNIQNHLEKINKHFLWLTLLFLLFLALHESVEYSIFIKKLTPYVAFITYVSGVALLIRVCRLLVLMYLFLGSMTAGVPLLIVNIFSLVLFVLVGFWSVSQIFGVQLTPLLATSAAFSVVLGLALQDTLGNLFAGISLQIDKTFEIGHWLEIQNGGQKIIGQVKELSWRATVLIGLTDEVITLPNKVVASSQISNFSPDNQPIIRSQTFKIAFGENADLAKDELEKSISQIADIRAIPSPIAYISEMTESWIGIKVIYFIDNFGRQFFIGDKVLNLGRKTLEKHNIKLAHQVIEIKK